jgi:hypothetical protein
MSAGFSPAVNAASTIAFTSFALPFIRASAIWANELMCHSLFVFVIVSVLPFHGKNNGRITLKTRVF